jgi:D-alanine-D-alanine ligase-like ATP-grasp enzyme
MSPSLIDNFAPPDEAPNVYPDVRKFSTSEYLCQEFVRLGFEAEVAGMFLVMASREGQLCFTVETETSFTSRVASRILSQKSFARDLFVKAGLCVPEGYAFGKNEKDRALRCLKKMGAAVIKPANGRKGRGVTVGATEESFEEAWSAALAAQSKPGLTFKHRVLLERQVVGSEARYLVVDGKCVAVSRRLPPSVVGDGTSTVRELVHQKNEWRKLNPNLGHRPILIDGSRERVLASQGLDLASRPTLGLRVLIDWKANISTGGESVDITVTTHPDLKKAAETVSTIIPGLDVVGIDIIAKDHRSSVESPEYAIIEANSRPGVGAHHFPVYGQPVNVCRLIAESCARRMGFDFPQELAS